jgi:hypothetical protein
VTKNKPLLIAVVATAAAIAAFWFFALAPKREEATKLQSKVSAKHTEAEAARSTLAGYEKSRAAYGKNYATVVRLGKAVPDDDDVRSLLVQLDAEADGTNVDFRTIQIGGGGADTTDAAAGASTPPPGAVSIGTAGFSATPFTFSFRGTYSNLQQFLSRMERFVTLRNQQVNVTGRLLRLESLDLQIDQSGFPRIRAAVGASSYQVPAAQGLTAGATPSGPGTTTPASTNGGGPAVPTTPATVTGATP